MRGDGGAQARHPGPGQQTPCPWRTAERRSANQGVRSGKGPDQRQGSRGRGHRLRKLRRKPGPEKTNDAARASPSRFAAQPPKKAFMNAKACPAEAP